MTLKKEEVVVPANLKEDLKAVFTKKQPVVYTTFCISQKAHDAIREHAKLSGLKNSVVFDLLLAVFKVCEKNPISLVTEENRTLIRKTYVVEKRTLHKLAEIAKGKKTSRDNIIEQAALQMKALFHKSESDRKEKVQKIFDTILNPFWDQVCDIKEKLCEELGGDDPICNRFGLIVSAVDGFIQDIEAYLTKGTPINPDF
ncbi:MAG: hypothetical protein Q8P28_10595 [Deltaproteobacteria bacterium]|nr:hypothetical protein [Deltaproteobacteria bacterium]